jgi:hypothetical protein
MAQYGTHGVHLCVGRTAIRTREMNFLENRAGRGQAEPGPAERLGNQHPQIAGCRQRDDELGWIMPLPIELAPIFAWEIRNQPTNGITNFLVLRSDGLRFSDHES